MVYMPDDIWRRDYECPHYNLPMSAQYRMYYSYEPSISSTLNIFLVLSVALMIWRCHFARFHNGRNPRGFCKYGCGLWNFMFEWSICQIIEVWTTGNALHWYSPCVVRLAVLVPTRVPLTLTKQVYSPSSSTPTLRIVKVGVVSPDTRSTSSKALSTSDPRSVLLHRYEMAGDPSALQLKVTLSPVVTVWSGMLSITEGK